MPGISYDKERKEGDNLPSFIAKTKEMELKRKKTLFEKMKQHKLLAISGIGILVIIIIMVILFVVGV
jgi:flagellar biosynthesis/type III secretory pathway M-ring protein FliF/YscJ